jgi:predicted transposase YbfD/YdcC
VLRTGYVWGKCWEKTNEITTIPKISDLSDITDGIITIDAMGTQQNIAEKIVADGADYILSVKGNQGGLEEAVRTTCKQNRPLFDVIAVKKGHGRIETRRCVVFAKGLTVDFENRRKKLTSVIKITSMREFANKTETEERFYIGSLSADNDFNKYIRDHWAAENCLHRTSDMTFREDEQRKRANHAAKNFAVARIGLNPLKKDPGKESLRTKRLKAAWNKDYLISPIKI